MMPLGNREGGEDDDAEPEELPDRNAVSSLRETGRRDFFCVLHMPFCRRARRFFHSIIHAIFVVKHIEKKGALDQAEGGEMI